MTQGETVQIKLTAKAQGRHTFAIRAYNLTLNAPEQTIEFQKGSRQSATWTGRIISKKEPWLAVVVPDGLLDARKEIGNLFQP